MNSVTVNKQLTPRQVDIYRFIVTFMNESGYPPTVREIGKQFEIASPNGVMCHLNALQKKGWIQRKKNLSRAIQLV